MSLKGLKRVLFGIAIVIACILGGTTNADLVTDFESEQADGLSNGSLTSLTVIGAGVSVEIKRSSGIGFDVINDDVAVTTNSFPTAVFGNQALSPFFDPTEPDHFVANFSIPVASVSLDAGDFGDDNDVISVRAYSGEDGTGTLLSTSSVLFSGNLNESGPENEPVTLVVDQLNGIGIRSITFGGNGGVNATNSVFFDNLKITAIPEPAASLVLLATSIAIVNRRRR